MARVSNAIITLINVLFLMISLVALGFSIWSQTHSGTHCQRVLEKPLLILGLALFVVSLFGLIGSCCRVSSFLWIYLAMLFLLIVGLLCFTVFTIIVTNKNVGHVLSNKGFKEAKLGDYSNWLQKHVINGENWDKIKSCFADMSLCQRLVIDSSTLSPTQLGCCTPPHYCGFQSQNATYWTTPKTGPAVPDSDCTTWSNVQTQLCFDCKSCKAAVLYNLKREWKLLAIINFCVLVIVIFFYTVGCCALRNNRSVNGGHRKAYYP